MTDDDEWVRRYGPRRRPAGRPQDERDDVDDVDDVDEVLSAWQARQTPSLTSVSGHTWGMPTSADVTGSIPVIGSSREGIAYESE